MKLNTMAYYGIPMEENHILSGSGLYSHKWMRKGLSFSSAAKTQEKYHHPSSMEKVLRILENADCVLSSPLYLCL